MLRNLIIVNASGVVIFQKEFIRGVSQPRLLGGLIQAMLTACVQKTGLPVTYIELANVSVAISTLHKYKVTCVLFHDQCDGQIFGKLICNEILNSFCETFSSQLGGANFDLGLFAGFNDKISEAIRHSVKPVLEHLQSCRGITLAVLVTGDHMEPHGVLGHVPRGTIGKNALGGHAVDKLAIMANLDTVINDATDIMSAQHDSAMRTTLECSDVFLELRRIQRSSLIVACDKRVKRQAVLDDVDEHHQILAKILQLINSLQDVWTGR